MRTEDMRVVKLETGIITSIYANDKYRFSIFLNARDKVSIAKIGEVIYDEENE